MVMTEENGVLLWTGMIGHSMLRYWCCWSSVVLSVLDVGASGDRACGCSLLVVEADHAPDSG